MTDKQLKNKAIDIKGKKYVLVSDRVLFFNEQYPNGCITTQRIMMEEPGTEVFKATVITDCTHPERYFTGYSQAKWWKWYINETSALENAETSAVWRALAMMGIGVIDSIASVDEINKAEKSKPQSPFQRALTNVEFMKQCLDEDDFIKEVKKHIKLDELQEWQLRKAYQDATKETGALPFD